MSVRRVLTVCAGVLALSAALAGAATGQSISATCSVGGLSAPCNQWFTSPVAVVWATDVAPDSTSPCNLSIAYRFNNDTNQHLACSAFWGMTSAMYSFQLQIEISAPSASATPDRPPDANGWYNHPVSVTFAGSAFSGIASCTAPQTFAGPATAGTSIAGSCVDNAGKTASASFPFRYDATPPALAATSQPADGSVDLSWQASAGPAPLQWVQVARAPGVAAAAADVLYQGGGTSYQDKRVRNGTRYTYTVTAMDEAGNMSQQTVTATPGARLLAPAAGARLSAPPALAWTAIPRAAYYNVQLFKGRHKIMSAWPTRPGLRLKRTWRFGAHRHRLARGTYRWYVWPGFGARKAAHYGRVIGMATFTMR